MAIVHDIKWTFSEPNIPCDSSGRKPNQKAIRWTKAQSKGDSVTKAQPSIVALVYAPTVLNSGSEFRISLSFEILTDVFRVM
jgi:hypothetical protein